MDMNVDMCIDLKRARQEFAGFFPFHAACSQNKVISLQRVPPGPYPVK